MNTPLISAAVLLTAMLAACGSGTNADGAGPTDAQVTGIPVPERTFSVIPDSSTLAWKGVMLGVKQHEGNISIIKAKFSHKGGQLTNGAFQVDMRSMRPTDGNFNKDYTKEKLIGHLSSADFFAVDSFPTASFVVKSVDGNTATGELTVRGRTNTETVTDIVVREKGGMATATGKLVFNRQKYGVSYVNQMKDMVISDDIEVIVSLVGKAS